MKLLRTVRQIWAGEYPPSRKRPHGLIEKLVFTPLTLIRVLSLSNIRGLLPLAFAHTFMDSYVIAFAAIVTLIALVPGHWGKLGVIVAVYRVADITTYRLYFMLVKSQAEPWEGAKLRRSIVIVLVNVYETVVAYAAIYLGAGGVFTTSTPAAPLASPSAALYFSAVTFTTVGYGDFIPTTGLARLVVVSELSTTILFLIFLIPALISLFSAGPEK